MLAALVMVLASTDWTAILLNGGGFGIMVALIIADKLTTVGERDRLRLKNDAQEQDIKALNESIRNDILPPLVQINGLMKDVIKELSQRGKYYPPEQRGEQ